VKTFSSAVTITNLEIAGGVAVAEYVYDIVEVTVSPTTPASDYAAATIGQKL